MAPLHDKPGPAESRARLCALAAVAALAVGAVSLLAREVGHHRHAYPPARGGWFSMDPDGLYHTRLVERLLREGWPPPARDPYLNHPEGALIPWPPYYTVTAWALLAPWAPEDPHARRPWLERAMASLPLGFGVLTSLLALGVAWRLAGPAAGLFAGLTHALTQGSIQYSAHGVGDHHALVSLLATALFALTGAALAADARRAPRLGAAAGAVAGLALGVWVASLLYVVLVQAVLGALLLAGGRQPRPGLGATGLAFHAAALLVLLPAVLHSPWREAEPWAAVTLSLLHPTWLALGGLVFVPLLALRPGGRAWRVYPLAVLLLGALLATGGIATGLGPASGAAQGFAWLSRSEEFMTGVLESEPLLGPDRTGTGGVFTWLGLGVLALPVAWGAAAHAALARGRAALLPWLVAVPVLLLQALVQRRFADPLAAPLAILLGVGLALVVAERARPALAVAAAGLAALALQAPSFLSLRDSLARPPLHTRELGWRLVYEWIHENGREAGEGAVLSYWDQGHWIEWIADRPSVATNFGTYIGESGFRESSRFFLERDPARAERILRERDVRFVVVPSNLIRMLPWMVRAAAGEPLWRYVRTSTGPDGGETHALQPAWYQTMAARLLGEQPPSFLRLAHRSSWLDPDTGLGTGQPVPAGTVFEYAPLPSDHRSAR